MCNERERLIGYVYEECDADEKRRVDQHLETCQTCRDEIGGLRSVREDLLAWEVPEHDSVWRPFAPARAVPWWREVPAWAMAAAASVMFAVGAAGGLVTHAFVSHQAALAPAQVVRTLPAGVTASELAALETRLSSNVQRDLTQMNQRINMVSFRPQATAEFVSAADVSARSDLAAQVARLYSFTDIQMKASTNVSNTLGDLMRRINQLDAANKELQRQVGQLQTLVLSQASAR